MIKYVYEIDYPRGAASSVSRSRTGAAAGPPYAGPASSRKMRSPAEATVLLAATDPCRSG